MAAPDLLAEADILRYLWVDNAGLVRAKGVHLPGVRDRLAATVGQPPARPAAVIADHPADPSDPSRPVAPSALREALTDAVTISQAQYSLPATSDTVTVEAYLLPTHDVELRPDWSTLRPLPYSPGQLAVACDLYDGGNPWPQCPRGFLRRMSQAAAAAGFQPAIGVELEFSLLDAVATEATGSPVPADRTPFALDSALDRHAPFVAEVTRVLQSQGVTVAQVLAESGSGQIEISLAHTAPLAAADRVVAAKQTIHAVARRHGMIASFLPLLETDAPGSAMHAHLSLTGDPFDGLGPAGGHFIAGVLAHLEALLAVTSPTPMGLLRYRPHFWAGAFQGWGEDNKEAALRVVPRPDGRPRDVEFKSMDATANPYTALGAILAAGLDGVRRSAELPEPLTGDPGLLTAADRQRLGIAAMPRDPSTVLARFADDEVLREAMGRQFHQTYLAVRRAEQAALATMDFATARDLLLERY